MIKIFKRKNRRNLTSFQVIIISFFGLILMGTILLMLPVSSAHGGFTSFSDLAAESGMRENNVQVTLSHIRKKLLAYLRKEGLL